MLAEERIPSIRGNSEVPLSLRRVEGGREHSVETERDIYHEEILPSQGVMQLL